MILGVSSGVAAVVAVAAALVSGELAGTSADIGTGADGGLTSGTAVSDALEGRGDMCADAAEEDPSESCASDADALPSASPAATTGILITSGGAVAGGGGGIGGFCSPAICWTVKSGAAGGASTAGSSFFEASLLSLSRLLWDASSFWAEAVVRIASCSETVSVNTLS